MTDQSSSKQPSKEERLSIESVCTSESLDYFLDEKNHLKLSFKLPKSNTVEHVSEVSVDMPLMELEPKAIGVMAGLGFKRKEKVINEKKPKTLSEKREAIQADIMKYGLATVEKMYPRQITNNSINRKNRPIIRPPFKMKPKPNNIPFDEIDARKILKPFSHHKYIKETPCDSVVYISRRKGLVPLSSLCKDSSTLLPSNVKLLQGRTVRLGKPNVYIESEGKLFAIGGSRRKENHSVNIIRIPSMVAKKEVNFAPFEIDQEFAKMVTESLHIPDWFSKKNISADLRSVKKTKSFKNKKSKFPLNNKNVAAHLLEKLRKVNAELSEDMEINENKIEESTDGSDNLESSSVLSLSLSSISEATTTNDNNIPEEDNQNINETSETSRVEAEELCYRISKRQKLYNAWSDKDNQAPQIPKPQEIETRAIVTEDFRVEFEKRKKNPLAGFEGCDVDECFCKDYEEELATNSAVPTEQPTPVSGSQTPSASAQLESESFSKSESGKVKNKLNKVKRALKTLGVNFLEYDTPEEKENEPNRECLRECCRMGCICDSIASKPIPPTHCGKVECMLFCFCANDDTLKLSSSKKVAISPAGAVKLRSTSQRNLAAEEIKFHNTVVATSSGHDLVMLGGSGRKKRERKLPSRYKDSEAMAMDSDDHNRSDSNKILNNYIEDYTLQTDPLMARMVRECLEDDTIKRCTALVSRLPIPKDETHEMKVWCMYHCEYNCPCYPFSDPLDYAPDKNVEKKKKSLKIAKIKRQEPIFSLSPPFEDSNTCARTQGIEIKRKNIIRMPHKIVEKKVPKKPLIPTEKPTKKVDLKKVSTDLDTLDLERELDLSMSPKGSTQCISFKQIKKQLEDNSIIVYVVMKTTKALVFINKADEIPYVTSAKNLKTLGKQERDTLPYYVGSLIDPPCDRDNETFSLLTHNGIAWEITGEILNNKQNLTTKVSSIKDSEFIDLKVDKQRLTPGVSLFTVSSSDNKPITFSLSPITPNQYWCLISHQTTETTVTCPDSKLKLKVDVLKQAVNLSSREDSVVRMPISLPGESSNFAIYALPGLLTHVFIGPFATKTSKVIEEICLDDDDEEEASKNDQQCSEESGSRRKQKLVERNEFKDEENANEGMMIKILENISDRAVINREEKRQKQIHKTNVITGQVPLMVDNDIEQEDEYYLIDDDEIDDTFEDQAAYLKANTEPIDVSYFNIPKSNHGIVVRRNSNSNPTFKNFEVINLHTDIHTYKIMKSPKLVTFSHPEYKDHDVICSNLEKCKKWIDEYEQSKIKPISLEDEFKAILNKKSLEKNRKTGGSGIRSCHEFNSGGRSRMAFFVDRKQKQEISKLFNSLAIETCLPRYKHPMTHAQILQGAKDLIESLTQRESNLMTLKKQLVAKRKSLFVTFTNEIKDLPIEVRKQKLNELRSIAKKRDHSKQSDSLNKSKTSSAEEPNPLITGFTLWSKNQKTELAAQGYSGNTLSKLLVEKWQNVAEEEKILYNKEAERLKKKDSRKRPLEQLENESTKQGFIPITNLEGSSNSQFNISHHDIRLNENIETKKPKVIETIDID